MDQPSTSDAVFKELKKQKERDRKRKQRNNESDEKKK